MLKALALVALLASVALFGAAREASTSFQQCQERQHTTEGVSLERIIALRCTASFLDSHNAIITAIATVLLATVTAGLLWLGYRQISTTHAQLRAYVLPSTAQMENFGPNLPPRASVMVTNSGQTPAYKLVVTTGVAFVRLPVERFPTLYDAPRVSRGVLGPGTLIETRAGAYSRSIDPTRSAATACP